MKTDALVLAAAGWLSLALPFTGAAFAQKAGGILKISHFDSPASMSLLEESTAAALRPVMGIFNNLVVYDQHVAQNSMRSNRSGAGHELVVERGRDRTDFPFAAGRQMA